MIAEKRITISLTDDQHAAVVRYAGAEDRTVASAVRRLLERGLAADEHGTWTSDSVAEMLSAKDEEIAHMKRLLSDHHIGYAEPYSTPPSKSLIVDESPLAPSRQARQKVIDAALAKVNRKTKRAASAGTT